MFLNQGTSKREASTSSGDIKPGFGSATPTDMGEQALACDMAWACEELDDAQLATVVGGVAVGGKVKVDVHGNVVLGSSPINISL